MKIHLCAAGAILPVTLLLFAPSALAQDTTESVSTQSDWDVFVDSDPTECWVSSQPKETVNTRGGQEVDVRRGEIRMFVTFRPSSGVAGEVSFTGGYPFAPNSAVNLQVGEQNFDLITDGEWAWSEGPEVDNTIVTALKAGSDAILTGRSSRGTTTKDTFSLIGFTAATGEAEARCQS
ncbi:MAG: invasion associated locus B family protein [Pseudomonadota bacterium]